MQQACTIEDSLDPTCYPTTSKKLMAFNMWQQLVEEEIGESTLGCSKNDNQKSILEVLFDVFLITKKWISK
jgi:hypothetical protein